MVCVATVSPAAGSRWLILCRKRGGKKSLEIVFEMFEQRHMTEEKKTKSLKVRVTESLLGALQKEAEFAKMSVNSYINLTLNASSKTSDILFDEKIGCYEKKEIESRVYFTLGEADVLRAYAILNGWSLSKEIRYRTVSSFAKKPKLNGEELKAIYAVRSSINVLGANLNRLVRDQVSLSNDNIGLCQDLALLMKELRDKINYLEKCSTSRFKLKDGGTDGR